MANAKLTKFLTEIGKGGVNALWPNDFEYYAITMELTDSLGNTIDYLTFPVSPESMSYDKRSLVNIKKSMSGISSLDNETFNPRTIEMSGTFGRKFKLLLGASRPLSSQSAENSTATGQFTNSTRNSTDIKESVFNTKLKTGYGTVKILEAMIEKSSALDRDNKPNRLYLYNPALGHNWLVKAPLLKLSQERTSSNMLWKYNLSLTAIAPLKRIRPELKTSLAEGTGITVLQRGLNSLVNGIKSSL